ncbi:Hint domain-containing protein [Actinokineospora globicatena]|uniref:Hint domain-containing protein n=1 Tax=Actinokineospora globicatena TaxID=103729 RepID=UPI0020A3BE2B|nr:Hint domain-containing protein [Actinokineospora globicatena]MCP2300632.1 intein C-terminal splicing region/intein N-terminal splicing region [Actinokineospora globicatena]GLW81176.1 hypothetical protein Aglo01_56570 [Actinokineospora globicatena]GLW88369.1 hypothetical protein Aglo02_60080 [Actinokineospora globicatena]
MPTRAPDAPHARKPDGPPSKAPDGPGAKMGKGPDGMPVKAKAGKAPDVPVPAKAVPDPRKLAAEAAARRAAAARAAFQAAVARTAKAKAVVAQVVKSNPLPAMKAALKPRVANLKSIVSSVPNAPARIVQTVVTNVQDLNKVYDQIKTAMLGVGKEIVVEAAQAQVAETLATAGVPAELLDLAGAAGGGKRKPGNKGKSARDEATSGGSCRVNSNSFDGTTPVLLADGTTKPIKDVVVGDTVLATDPTTGETSVQPVTDVRSHKAERLLYEITITDGGTLTATDEHPFWIDSLQKWIHAEDLHPGYTFQTADHRPTTITTVRPLTPDRQVYNLTVDTLHTYYVGIGTTAVLTHNNDLSRWEGRYDDCAVNDAAFDLANSATYWTHISNKKKPGVAEALRLPSGLIITGLSNKGPLPVLHPDLGPKLEEIEKTGKIGNGHGKCGLLKCISQAWDQGLDIRGSSAAAWTITRPGYDPGNQPIKACDTCEHLVAEYEISFKTRSEW